MCVWPSIACPSVLEQEAPLRSVSKRRCGLKCQLNGRNVNVWSCEKTHTVPTHCEARGNDSLEADQNGLEMWSVRWECEILFVTQSSVKAVTSTEREGNKRGIHFLCFFSFYMKTAGSGREENVKKREVEGEEIRVAGNENRWNWKTKNKNDWREKKDSRNERRDKKGRHEKI